MLFTNAGSRAAQVRMICSVDVQDSAHIWSYVPRLEFSKPTETYNAVKSCPISIWCLFLFELLFIISSRKAAAHYRVSMVTSETAKTTRTCAPRYKTAI